MAKVVCISDTHNQHERIAELPAGNILIHAGDMTGRGKHKWLRKFADWMRSQTRFDHKIAIAGNHDITLQTEAEVTERYMHGFWYLNETSVVVSGLKVFGTPWSPWFKDWAFNAWPGWDCQQHWAKIPLDADIVVVHGPPFGLGDLCYDGKNVGCPDLLNRLEEIKPKLVVCGHIHEGYGVYTAPWGSTKVVNASLVDLGYRLVNEPVVVDI